MKRVMAKPEFEVAYQDVCALAGRHADKVSSIQLLAIAANMVGKLIAMQDQRRHTSEEIMELVAQNIEAGNQQAVAQLMEQTAGSA